MKTETILAASAGAIVALAAICVTHLPTSPVGPTQDRVGSSDHRRMPIKADSAVLEATPSAPTVSASVNAMGSDCTRREEYVVDENGNARRLLRCDPLVRAPRPYEDYPTASLETLVYGDSVAAAELALRLRDRDLERAMRLVFRAAAIGGGDGELLLAFSNAYPHPVATEGRPNLRTLRSKYLLSAVAARLGAEGHHLHYWEAAIRRASPDGESDLETLRRKVRAIVEDMRSIELEVTGESTLGGQADA